MMSVLWLPLKNMLVIRNWFLIGFYSCDYKDNIISIKR